MNTQGPRILGFDTLRIIALLLITWQHVATTLGAYAETQWRGISPGQSGVAIFCTIAAWLASRVSPSSPLLWCKRRLLVLFPAYWIVTVAAFVLVLLTGQKAVTPSLFVSQMLGLGYFTHGWDLVNVVSWFLSLILLCYGLTAMAWLSGRPRIFWLAVVALCTILLLTRSEVALSRHVLAYAAGALLALAPTQERVLLPLLLLVLLAGIGLDPQFFYAGCGGLLVLCAVHGWLPGHPFMASLNRYSYEYFLVHGICLVAVFTFVRPVVLGLPLALSAALLAAFVLQHLQTILAVPLARMLGADQ